MPEFSFPVTEGVTLVLRCEDGWDAEHSSNTIAFAAREFAGALATMAAKERYYGGAWREQGWMGNLARIMSKTARLRSMLWRDMEVSSAEEPFTDTLQDLMNLCVFMILNRHAGNRWGRGE